MDRKKPTIRPPQYFVTRHSCRATLSIYLHPRVPQSPRGLGQVNDMPIHLSLSQPPLFLVLSLSLSPSLPLQACQDIPFLFSPVHWKESLIKCSELWGLSAPFNYFCFMFPPTSSFIYYAWTTQCCPVQYVVVFVWSCVCVHACWR